MRQAVVFKGEVGQWVAECLSLPGCISQGRTREEAIDGIREAIRLYIAVLEEDHRTLSPKNDSTLSWSPCEQTSPRLWSRIRARVG